MDKHSDMRWMSPIDVKDYLRLPSMGALYKLVARGQLPYARRGRRLVFDRLLLDKQLERATVKAADGGKHGQTVSR